MYKQLIVKERAKVIASRKAAFAIICEVIVLNQNEAEANSVKTM